MSQSQSNNMESTSTSVEMPDESSSESFRSALHPFRPIQAPNPTITHNGTLGLRRQMEQVSTRSFRDNLQNVFQEIRPLVETVHNNWLNVQSSDQHVASQNSTSSSSNSVSNTNPHESFVINLEHNANHQHNNHAHSHSHDVHVHHENHQQMQNNDGNENHQHRHNTDMPVNEVIRQTPEARELITALLRYLPFLLILLAKCLYDNRETILILLILLITFIHGNKVVVREAAKQQRKSFRALGIEAAYIICCIILISYMFKSDSLFLNLVFVGSYVQIFNVWNLLWTVCIVDFTLKLITIGLKLLLVSLPNKVLPYRKRGKFYYMLEMISQLYRALVPIQPWLYYLLHSYHGTEKVMGVLLSAAYMVSKGTDLLQRGKAFRTAIIKLLHDVNLGIAPTVEQLLTAGNQCPICHDEYTTPVLLSCRHIFCEPCVTIWFDREQTCPLCRAKVVEDPSFKNGATTYFMQLY